MLIATRSLSLAIIGTMVFWACGRRSGDDESGLAPIVTVGTPAPDSVQSGNASVTHSVRSVEDLPACDEVREGQVIYTTIEKRFYGCSAGSWNILVAGATPVPGSPGAKGDTGATGATGPSGTAGTNGTTALSYVVRDSGGQNIGTTSLSEYVKFNDGNSFALVLADGTNFVVQPSSGRHAGDYCFYAASDCTGHCLYPTGTGASNKLLLGMAGFYKISTASSGSMQAYNSYAAWSGGSLSCLVLGSTQMANMGELSTIYNFPSGVSYPVPVPMEVATQ